MGVTDGIEHWGRAISVPSWGVSGVEEGNGKQATGRVYLMKFTKSFIPVSDTPTVQGATRRDRVRGLTPQQCDRR